MALLNESWFLELGRATLRAKTTGGLEGVLAWLTGTNLWVTVPLLTPIHGSTPTSQTCLSSLRL